MNALMLWAFILLQWGVKGSNHLIMERPVRFFWGEEHLFSSSTKNKNFQWELIKAPVVTLSSLMKILSTDHNGTFQTIEVSIIKWLFQKKLAADIDKDDVIILNCVNLKYSWRKVWFKFWLRLFICKSKSY